MLTPVNSELFFKGRPEDFRLGQWVQTELPQEFTPSALGLFGCPDDQGIKINRGRPGAQFGPEEIRKAFYKIAFPSQLGFENLKFFDLGNIPIGPVISDTHKKAYEAAKTIAARTNCVVLLGGGHDFAAPGFLGTIEGVSSREKLKKWGLINIDPHLDVRDLEENHNHSGSSFRSILESGKLNSSNLIEFGCRNNRNSAAHFTYCKERKVSLVPLEVIQKSKASPARLFKNLLAGLSRKVDYLGVSLDMDCCYEVSGTSAATVVGFSIKELIEMAFWVGKNPLVRYFEIAEVSPPLDPQGKTALVAAEILFSFLCGRAENYRLSKRFGSKEKKRKTLKNPK